MLFLLLQFVPRPEKNISASVSKNSIETFFAIPDSVKTILKTTCYDCHSNNTQYPWYSHIQPVAWFMNRHIVQGKEELNFDEFGNYSRRRQQSKLKSIASQVRDGEMPLGSYKLLHNDARLGNKEKEILIQWAQLNLETKY